jgi:hypothetical protein
LKQYRGLNNPEAAAALFISCKIAEAHLTRAYRQLGVRSRTELTSLLLTCHQASVNLRADDGIELRGARRARSRSSQM